MAKNEERAGGVLVVPQESWYPPSVTIKSPNRTREVPTNDGGTKRQAIFYTFERGKPRRVDHDEDYQVLKEMTHYAGMRGVIPLFDEVETRQRLDGQPAAEKIVDTVKNVLAQEGINLEQLVDSAEAVGLEAEESPTANEDGEE